LDQPRILYLTSGRDDFMADGLFHGLRGLLGDRVVDVPKLEHLYEGYPAERRRSLHGWGFTLSGLLPDLPVDRGRAFDRAAAGEFDLVLFADIWWTMGLYAELLPQLDQARTAVVDGSDRVELAPYAGRWWRVPYWWTLPRPHRHSPYFKRELTPDTMFFRYYMAVPRALSRWLPFPRSVHPTSFCIPDEKLVEGPAPKTRELATHVVDREVAERVGATGSYAFEREEDYYEDLRSSRFGVCMRRAGWDSLRVYEMAANGCVPCFRDLDRKPPRCAPHGLDATNCVIYHSADELLARLRAMTDSDYERLRDGALAWARANSTSRRAEEVMSGLGFDVRS
jgi:hypothetical protein